MYLKTAIWLIILNLFNCRPLFDDACIFSPCKHGQLCFPKANFEYDCIDEKLIQLNFKPPVNFINEYTHDYDSCISSPCSFGTICKSLPDNNYICLAEIDKSLESQYARQLYKDMENRYASAIKETLYNKAASSHVSMLKDRRKPVRNPCDSSPCETGYTCQTDDQFEDGYSCVQDPFSMIVQKENRLIREYLEDKEFVHNITIACSTRELSDRLPNPKNANQFIVCLDDYEFSIMDCPDGFVFNAYMDRCDYTPDRVNVGCDSSPCQYGAKCVDLETEGEYKCECPSGFSGKNCEKSPDFCASNPCGANGQCHSLPYDSPMPYYCTCSDNKTFGVSCDADSELNPCLNDESELEAFATSLDDSIYVQCNEHKMYLKYCPKPFVFSEEKQKCRWNDKEQE